MRRWAAVIIAMCIAAVPLVAPTVVVGAPELVQDANPRSPEIPPATVTLIPPAPARLAPGGSALAVPATLTPATLNASLREGECITENKTLVLPLNALPAKLDLVFSMDLTGSMGDELNNVKVNSVNIMNTLRGLIPDSDFGAMSHMDYRGSFVGCGWSSQYGDAGSGDYPYQLDSPVQSSIPAVQAAINSLALGWGADSPENYSRPFFESYSDPAVAWRAGARRFVVAWLDDVPHDCNVWACTGPAGVSTGPDPGRDNIANNADDLAILNVVDAMGANNITLIVLYSGIPADLPLWRCLAQRTGAGGDAFQINSDGTIPGGVDIATYIRNRVTGTVQTLASVSLEVCDPSYATWLTGVTPPAYTNVVLDVDRTLLFDIQLCVPAGTPPGLACFDVCAVGDGAEYARQHVCIDVGGGPNCPKTAGFWTQQCAQNENGSAKFSAAEVTQIAERVDDLSAYFSWAAGTDFAAFCATIDPPSPMTQQRQALRQFAAMLANVATGQLGLVAWNGDMVNLNTGTTISCPGFSATTIGGLIAEIDAALLAATALTGGDAVQADEIAALPIPLYTDMISCLDAINNGNGIGELCPESDVEMATLGSRGAATLASRPATDEGTRFSQPRPNPFTGSTSLSYRVSGSGEQVRIAVFDLTGRRVRELVNAFQPGGEHAMTWDGRADDGHRVRPGMYFIRGTIGTLPMGFRVAVVQ